MSVSDRALAVVVSAARICGLSPRPGEGDALLRRFLRLPPVLLSR